MPTHFTYFPNTAIKPPTIGRRPFLRFCPSNGIQHQATAFYETAKLHIMKYGNLHSQNTQ